MYCEYLEFYFPKVCYFLLIGLLEFCYFSFQHDSDHSFSSVLSLLGLSLGLVKSICLPLCSDQTSDISGSPRKTVDSVFGMGQWAILDGTSISLTL